MTIEPPATPSTGFQVGVAASKAVLSAVPFAGGALAEVLDAVTTRGYERRRVDWMRQVSEELNRLLLEPRGLDWDSLETNERFLDAIGQATRAALQTRDTTKIEALRNAVVNAAIHSDLDGDRTAILLDLVGTLTGTHLRVLSTFANPKAAYATASVPFPNVYAGARMTVVRDLMPDLAADSWLVQKIEHDLKTHYLADLNFHSTMTNAGIFEPCIMPLGSQLIALITLQDDSAS